MKPKPPGDILADTIEEWMKGPLGLSKLREILAEYRKPARQYFFNMPQCKTKDYNSPDCVCWHDEGAGPLASGDPAIRTWREKPQPSVSILTPKQIAAGWVEWHGGDCPVFGGSKPTVMFLDGETRSNSIASEWLWKKIDSVACIVAYLPDPLEAVKKAHSEGKMIQWRFRGNPSWDDCHEGNPPEWSHLCEYRVKPAPVMVDLCAEDIAIGSEFLAPDKKRRAYAIVCEKGVTFYDIHRTFAALRQNGWLIHRPGKYDADGNPLWEKAEKPEGGK